MFPRCRLQRAPYLLLRFLTYLSSASPENEISNLDHLVHLKWLDLSFNNIKAITGLDKLTELMDLSLYNNQVKKRQNTSTFGGWMRGCVQLHAVLTRALSSWHPSSFCFVFVYGPRRRCAVAVCDPGHKHGYCLYIGASLCPSFQHLDPGNGWTSMASAPLCMPPNDYQISEIEGLDSCSNLQCLSLGNNRIANLDSIIRLRRYPKLQLVNLEVQDATQRGNTARSFVFSRT